ncbi:trypsin-like serine protease (plasmid) [Streptomyces sp. CA-294286]|uniref:trypsin-like serine protease n=1 Tax=Streptomyces sp. CA-294286 TaxID=3240070 RepID=UPI003D8DAF4A
MSLLSASAVAAGLLTAAPASAVSGITPAIGSYAFTAKLTIGDNHRSCTGALVDEQWILTASSCFADNPAQAFPIPAGAPKQKTTATIGRTDLATNAGKVVDVVQLVPRQDRDMVMAKLATPVTDITPVALAASVPVSGEKLVVSGFGQTKDEWVPDRLHTGTFTVDATGENTIAITGDETSSICKGDAGGPALRTTGGVVELVGVNSTSWQGGCFNVAETRRGAVESRVDDINMWVQQLRFPNGVPLPAGTSLGNGEVLTSKASKLSMNNGVLSITSNAGKVIWSAGTSGNPGARAVMENSGNLAICAPAATDADLAACASDTTKTKRLWSTNIPAPTAAPNNSAAGAGGVAVLQNRGNLVIYNAKGQSLWTSGTAPRNDYNGDGRSDMAAWYSYSDGHSALQTIKSNADGSLAQPFQSYSSAIGSWNIDKIQLTTGDYNGDGRGDTAIMANYGNGKAQLFTSLGKPDGGFEAPFVAWTSTPGSWYAERATLHSGDFDGDGRDDIAAWFDFSSGRDTLYTFTSTPKGGFNAPFSSWTNPSDWNVANLKFATGDFDADGRDDIGGLYRYADGSIKMFSFLTTADGKFQASLSSWASSTFGDWNRTNVHAGDFNADGRDDIAAWYDYSDGRDAVHILTAQSTPDGHFATPVEAYKTAAGNFHYPNMRMVAGDYNGDGRDDLAAMYGYSDGKVRMFTWTANKDGKLNGALGGWTSATTTSWNINASTFLRNAN